MIIKNGLVFTLKEGGSFEPLTINTRDDEILTLTDGTQISSIPTDSAGPDTIIDATGCYVIPGLVDVHFHGAGGFDFCDGTTEALKAICEYEFKNGITDICPATMTIAEGELEKVLESAASFATAQGTAHSLSAKKQPPFLPLADLIGIHMEGPFLSPDKKGAQNPDHITPADPSLIQKWLDKSENMIKLMTIAPESPGAMECIEKFRDKIQFSIGHTNADYVTAKTAMDKGAHHVTHLFNAMPPLSHRAPGVIGAAADHGTCMVELICDGIHVDPSVIRSAFKLFGEDRIILISDSLRATGMPEGTYTLGGQTFTLKGKLALLEKDDAGTIAGSVCNLYDCMIKAVEFGIPLTLAIKAATINPCRSIGMADTLGSIAPGKKAHFLLLDKHDLSIKRIIKGQRYL